MYNTILVPLDGSKRAEAILRHVEELAQRYDATVVFLRVIEPVVLRVPPEGAYPALEQRELEHQREEAQSYLAARQGEFREKGIEARARVVYGPVVEAIIDAAERERADLIAIASHGRSGLSRVFYGSVAAGVLHRVDRPLLVVRSRGSECM
jgi:nucleotide-binding universal stress UspA family protein